MTRRTGFVETLEVTLASLLFFIFLINILPTFVAQNEDISTRNRVIDTVEALADGGQLRDDVIERDLAGLDATISERFPAQDVTVGLAWADVTQGTSSRSVQIPPSDRLERVVIRAWNPTSDAGDSLTLEGSPVFSDPVPQGHSSAIVTDNVTAGTMASIGVSGSLRYSVETYSYELEQSLPEDENIRGYGYVFGGTNSTIQPSELRVFLW